MAIIQARMGSSELPGKVLLDIEGEPMLVHCVERVRRATLVDRVVVATTHSARDDSLVALADRPGWSVFRGAEDDVLDRYHRAAQQYGAETIIRITSDCPMIDPTLIDQAIQEFDRHAADYLTLDGYPRGLDVEVMGRRALETAWNEDEDPAWREHVTPYLYRNPEKFRVHYLRRQEDLSWHRWTVDTGPDLELVRRVFGELRERASSFGMADVLEVLERHPEWVLMNSHVVQREVPPGKADAT